MQKPRGKREHGVLTETQSLGWRQCGVPVGVGEQQKMRLERQVSMQLSTVFTRTTFPPILAVLSLELKKDFHPPNSLFPALASFGI